MQKTVISIGIMAIVLLGGSAYAAPCDCTACHGAMHNDCTDWGTDVCNTCHGNPPISGVTGTGGLVKFPSPTGATAAGGHTILSHRYGGSAACQHCHFGGMPLSPIIGNNRIQIGFSINGFGGQGTSYDAAALNAPYAFEGTNGTVITTGGSGRCSNLYCHSDGAALSTGIIGVNASPPWSSTTGTVESLACDTCHGFPPLYAQDAPKANSHAKHASFTTCDLCHFTTTADGVHVTNAELNADGKYDVVPNSTKNFTLNGQSAPITFTYVFDAGGGACTNNSCHQLNGWSEGQGRIWGNIRPWATSGVACRNTGLEYGQEVCAASGVGGGSPPYTYRWEFSDGSVVTTPTATHIFGAGEQLAVRLTIRDANRHAYTTYATVETPSTPPPPPLGGCTPGVYSAPTVTGSAALSGGAFPATVTLTDASYICSDYYPGGVTDPFSTYLMVSWGDGSSSETYPIYATPSLRYFSHTYTGHNWWDYGRHFSICVTAADAAGAMTTQCHDAGI